MKVWRWPALVLVALVLVAAFVIERRQSEDPGLARDTIGLTEGASPPESLSSTWYCAGGTATGTEDGTAEQTVVVANGGSELRRGRLTVYPSEGTVARRDFEVPAHSRVDLKTTDTLTAPNASVLIEVDGGEISVQHELRGPDGRSVSACASTPAADWYFPAGTSRAGTKMVLSVFNPFPGDAILDIAFSAEDGVRTPQSYQGLVVPGGRVMTLPVSDVVTLRNEVSTSVRARTGRIVVDQIQTSDGTGDLPRGLTATLGAPVPNQAWVFPDGIGADSYTEQFALFNPSDSQAEVDVQVVLDDPAVNGVAEPFQVRVAAGRSARVDVFGDGRIPPGVAHSVVVTSTNDVPIVAERVIIGTKDAAQPGIGYTMGSPVVATRWMAPIASTPGTSGAAVIVVNPQSESTATVTIRALVSGTYGPIDGMDSVVLAPGERHIFDLGATGLSGLAIEVGSDQPVVAETRFGFKEGDDLSYLVAEPVGGSIAPARVATLSTRSTDIVVVGGSDGSGDSGSGDSGSGGR